MREWGRFALDALCFFRFVAISGAPRNTGTPTRVFLELACRPQPCMVHAVAQVFLPQHLR